MPTAVAKNTIYLVAASVFQKFFSFLYFTMVARALGAERVGMYVTALAFSSMFSIAVDLGLTAVLIREGAKEEKSLPRLLSHVLTIKIVLAFLAYGALWLVAWKMNYSGLIQELIHWAGVIMVLDSVSLSIFGVLRAKRQLSYESLGVIITQLTIVVAGLLVLWLGWGVRALLLALGLGSIMNVLWGFYALFKQNFIWQIDWSWLLSKKLARLAAPFAFAGIFTKVYSYIDTVMLSYLLGSKAAGWYSVPYKVGFAFQFIPMAFAASLYPAMSNFFVQDKERLRGLFEKGILYLSFLALPLSFGLGALADVFIIKIFGEEFRPSIVPLQILLASVLFAFLDFPVGSLLNACNRQNVQTGAMGLTMVINIIANWFLIPRLGVIGAALAALFGNFTLLFIGALWVPKIIAPMSRLVWIKILKALLAAGVMGVLVASIKGPLATVVEPRGLGLAVYFGVLALSGALIYGGIMIGLRVVDRQEITEILAMFKKRAEPLDKQTIID